MKKNLKLIIFLCMQFVIVLTIILIVLFAGKKTYTVTFNINGGNHIGGELVQTVRYGKSATPPVVTKDGCYLLQWSRAYDIVTSDIEVYAIWEYETSYGIEFEIVQDSNYCLISGCYENISGDIYIGSFYQGKKVLGIKEGAFKNCKYITGIYLLDGMISIGDEAFYGCTNLKNIVIPSTVETIGKNALSQCNKLENISVSFFGDSRLYNTKPFFGYLFGGTSYSDAFKVVPRTLKNITLTQPILINDYAFYKCANIETVTINNEIEMIGENAFRNCGKLKYIKIPSKVKTIGKGAFVNCKSLTEISLSSSLEVLGEAAFANCTKLEKVTINSNVNNIPLNAFQNCTKLNNFVINNNEHYVFENAKLFSKNGDAKEEYVISSQKYTDDVDDSIWHPTIIVGPIIGPIKDPNIDKIDPEIDGIISKDDLIPSE